MCLAKQSITLPSLGVHLDALTGGKPTDRPKRTSKSGKRRDQFIVVTHNYHDHAEEPASQEEQVILDSAKQNPLVASFPMKLFMMLEQVEEDGNAHIVSWQPHGRCFAVHQPELFKELLPRYFSLSKVSSFQRQLNLYDFTRLTRGKDKGGYYNEFFLRGRAHLLSKIQRIKVKGTGVRARSNPEEEPNFWQMPFVGATPEAHASASIVSADDEEERVMVPLHTSSAQEDQLAFRLPAEEVSTTPSEIKLCGWGMPFYYLDSLPSDARPALDADPSADFLNSLDMDDFVQNVVDVDSDLSFNMLLEQIVD
jgi:hypothetical protein